jgi:hypothetical protein
MRFGHGILDKRRIGSTNITKRSQVTKSILHCFYGSLAQKNRVSPLKYDIFLEIRFTIITSGQGREANDITIFLPSFSSFKPTNLSLHISVYDYSLSDLRIGSNTCESC